MSQAHDNGVMRFIWRLSLFGLSNLGIGCNWPLCSQAKFMSPW